MDKEDGVGRLLEPLQRNGRAFYALASILTALVALGVYAYIQQLFFGLAVTGLRDRVMWGLYISNFVFFIGISHAGTLISAILRVTNTEWRKPITRMAEATTVMALMVASIMPFLDLGRPERILHLLVQGRIQSPILWDVVSISTYLIGSVVYLLLPIIPDAALCGAKIGGGWRSSLYRFLSFGWDGREEQKKSLVKAIGAMAVIIIPVAVSVHTVVSWIFGMTLRVGWHSTIFGPYFVVGAILSGISTLILVMAVFRRFYRLEAYLKPLHFRNLGLLLLVLIIGLLYFTLSEYLTLSYGGKSEDVGLLSQLFIGDYSLMFWGMIALGFAVPAVILAVPYTRTVTGIIVAALLSNVGMWVERYLIVVSTLAYPQLSDEWAVYQPSWVEASITIGSFAGFALMLLLFSKIFPVISAWEVGEGNE